MKMIVDIPDTMRDWILNGYPDQNDFMLLLDIIRNGTPLRITLPNNVLRHEVVSHPNPNVLEPFIIDCPVSHPNPKECETCIHRRGDAEKCAECMNGKDNYVLEEEQNETAD